MNYLERPVTLSAAKGAGCKRSEKRSEKRWNSGDECRMSLNNNKIKEIKKILFSVYII